MKTTLITALPATRAFSQRDYGNNTVQDYLVAAGPIAGGLFSTSLCTRPALKHVVPSYQA